MAVAWLVLGVLLVFVELHHLAFFALFGAVGAFAASLAGLLAPPAVALQVVVFAAVALVGVLAVRPSVSRAYERRHPGQHVAGGVHGGIVGQQAVALDEVGDEGLVGHVRLFGERWLAQSGEGRPIEPGRTVTVTAVVGTTLVVWPSDGMFSLPDAEAPDSGERDATGDVT
jgi:membrane protein implicated in regulation of membrane protease activity